MTALLVLLLAIAGCQGRDEAPLPGPHFVLAERAHDLGVVEQGIAVKHVFPFRNDGGRALRLGPLRAGCGCTAAIVPGDVVPPGGSGSIELSCNTSALAGPVRRTATVYSNDPRQASAGLELDLDVAADVAPARPQFYFGRARRGERTARDIRLLLPQPDAAPRAAHSESGTFGTSLEKRGDGEWRVALTVSPSAPAGVVRDRVIIDTGSARLPRLIVPVVGTVEAERGAAE